MDNELEVILVDLPKADPQGWAHIAPNAFVCIDPRGRVAIFLVDGGWLGIPVASPDLQADLAPWSD